MKPIPQEITVPQCGCVARKFNENCSYATQEEYLQEQEYQMSFAAKVVVDNLEEGISDMLL